MNEQDQRVRDHYEKMSLPKERLEHLLNAEGLEADEKAPNGLLARLHSLSEHYRNMHSVYRNTALGMVATCFVVLALSSKIS